MMIMLKRHLDRFKLFAGLAAVTNDRHTCQNILHPSRGGEIINMFIMLVKALHQSQPNFILPWRFVLYRRRSSEEYLTILLPVLAKVVMRRGKSLIEGPDRSRKWSTAVRRVNVLWTGTRAATYRTTCMDRFLVTSHHYLSENQKKNG